MEMTVEKFLNEELSNYAKYSCYRGLPSYIDGFKNAGRKVIYTAQSDLKKETKVSVFAGIAMIKTQYLHGDISGSIVNLARNYCGTNNLPLLIPSGNFGTRMMPENSATRYIFTEKQNYFDKLLNPDDNKILIEQEFEGEKIEPRFFVPSLPLVLINGSKGLATGFACEILPRKTTSIIKYIKEYLKTNKSKKELLKVHFNGFKGFIEEEGNKIITHGVFERDKYNTIVIKEIPIGYDLLSYKKHLDSLEEKKKIKSYEDFSEDDNFSFVVKVEKTFFDKDDDYIEKTLNLSKSFTENFTCLDEDTNIKEFDNVEDLIKSFIDIKLEYIQKRKDYILKEKTIELKEHCSEYLFIKMVLDNIIDLKKMNKDEIINILKENEKIIQKNDSYDYLLRIPILNFTPNKLDELKTKIKNIKSFIDELSEKTPSNIWLEELEVLEKIKEFE